MHVVDQGPVSQDSDHTEGRILGFAYSFGVPVAMLLLCSQAAYLQETFTPVKIFKMADVQGVWLAKHGMAAVKVFLAESAFCMVSILCQYL